MVNVASSSMDTRRAVFCCAWIRIRTKCWGQLVFCAPLLPSTSYRRVVASESILEDQQDVSVSLFCLSCLCVPWWWCGILLYGPQEVAREKLWAGQVCWVGLFFETGPFCLLTVCSFCMTVFVISEMFSIPWSSGKTGSHSSWSLN